MRWHSSASAWPSRFSEVRTSPATLEREIHDVSIDVQEGIQSPHSSMKCSLLAEGVHLPVVVEPAAVPSGGLELADVLGTVKGNGSW